MDEAELIEGLKWLLEHAMLSGAERDFCEQYGYAGFPKVDKEDSPAVQQWQREHREDVVSRARAVLHWRRYQRP